MEFFIVGATKQPQQEIERKIQAMGGKMATRIHANLTAVISNAEVVAIGEGIIREAFINRIQVISDDFLNEVMDNDPIAVIVRNDLSKYGRDVRSFFYFCVFDEKDNKHVHSKLSNLDHFFHGLAI